MKRIIILLLTVFVIPVCVFAQTRGFYDFTIGVTAQSSYNLKDVKNGELSDFSFDKVAFGAEVETKVSIFSLNTKVLYDRPNGGISGMICGHISIDLLNFLSMLRVKAGLGYEYGFNIHDGSYYIGNSNGRVTGISAFKDACLDVNAGIDVMLGSLTLGINATIPTKTSLANGQWRSIPRAVLDGWKLAKLGLSMGYCLQ